VRVAASVGGDPQPDSRQGARSGARGEAASVDGRSRSSTAGVGAVAMGGSRLVDVVVCSRSRGHDDGALGGLCGCALLVN
jgi:hypothetical protein